MRTPKDYFDDGAKAMQGKIVATIMISKENDPFKLSQKILKMSLPKFEEVESIIIGDNSNDTSR